MTEDFEDKYLRVKAENLELQQQNNDAQNAIRR